MFIAKRIPATFVGVVFLLSGLGKIGNVVGFQRLIVDSGLGALHIVAPFIILTEILIGTLLVFHFHTKVFSLFAIILLVCFTLVFTYAWLLNGITDCGCFGKYIPITSTPLITYTRNGIMIILLILAYIYDNNIKPLDNWQRKTLYTIMFAATFVAGMSFKPMIFINREHSFEKKHISETPLAQYSKTQSGYSELIMFFSYTCPHCINSLENYKAWSSTHSVSYTTAYAVIDHHKTNTDSLRILHKNRFGDIEIKECNRDSVDFITVFPTSFLIKNDSIQAVIVGTLPSPYLLSDIL